MSLNCRHEGNPSTAPVLPVVRQTAYFFRVSLLFSLVFLTAGAKTVTAEPALHIERFSHLQEVAHELIHRRDPSGQKSKDVSGLGAVVSELLRRRFNEEVGADQLLVRLKRQKEGDAAPLNLLNLKQMLMGLGYRSFAYKLTSEDMVRELLEQQNRLRDGPYLLVPKEPYRRFYLFLGADDDHAYLQDPVLGEISVPHAELLKVFRPLVFAVQGHTSDFVAI